MPSDTGSPRYPTAGVPGASTYATATTAPTATSPIRSLSKLFGLLMPPITTTPSNTASNAIAANAYAGSKDISFSIVRYGNVAGSRGSVIPFFKDIIESGRKELPITDYRMTRFWISLEQGVELVIKALNEGSSNIDLKETGCYYDEPYTEYDKILISFFDLLNV